MKVLKVLWFGNWGVNTLGIIKAKDNITHDIKFYIGVGRGISEQEDIDTILAGGTKYEKIEFEQFFESLMED